jgi:alkylated DNA repair protein alkB homolog 1
MLFTSQLMHRDLANPAHKINLQQDYAVPYQEIPTPLKKDEEKSEYSEDLHAYKSFFTYPQASDCILAPKNSETHKPLNMAQFLSSKLRWLTLGSQYDWPTRSYDKQGSTVFPPDLAKLVTGLFPHIRPESGVVLIYSSKDYMPVHRDVSEQCERALASFSLGCDGIFVIARGEDGGEEEKRPRTAAIRVRSGDCIHLDGEARWAWHAMARTLPSTCPKLLADWPVGTPGVTGEEKRAYEKWKGYMSTKRINISCRQVWD